LESFIGAWIRQRIEDKLDVNQYGAVFIDFAKAFDHVDHNIRVAKLIEFGLPDVIIRWMCSFLQHRRQRVKIGDVMSDWLVIDAGMPQGSFLGPLTFIMWVDSLQASCFVHDTQVCR